jgi:PAS domain S-box-containing protein
VSFDATGFEAVIDAIAEGVIVCDDTGRPLLANQRALDLLGMTLAQVRREEPVDPSWVALRPDGSIRPFDDLPVERALRLGAPVHHDLHGIRRTDGSVVWLTANVELVADRHEGGPAVVATFRDTTELHVGRNVDHALLRMATRLVERPAGDASTIDAHLADLGALCGAERVLFIAIEHERGRARVTHDWSRPAETMPRTSTGVALDLVPRLLGRLTRRELVHLDPCSDGDEISGGLRQVLAAWQLSAALAAPVVSGATLEAFLVIGWSVPGRPDQRVVDGVAVAAELLAARLELDRVHQDLRELNATLDDRVRARSAELVDERDRIRTLVDAVPDILFEIDADGRFAHVHAPDPSMLIMPAEDFIGRPSDELFREHHDIEVVQEVSSHLRENPSDVAVLEFTTDVIDGTVRSYECRVVPRTNGGMVAVVRDITGQAERARLQREHAARLARANEDLERAVRAKDEFLAGIGHELRTPLAAILGLTEILLEDDGAPLESAQRTAVETIRASGGHLLSLINDLLDLDQITTRMTRLDLDHVRLDEVARLAVDLVRTTADNGGVVITLDPGEGMSLVRADRRRLGQVLLNLLENAVKFTPEGGTVGVDLWMRDPDTAAVTVWDTGIGLDPRDHERIFEPFTQVDSGFDRRYVGSGLGLTLAARFVELHHGSIEVVSALGAGARFTVLLPVTGPTGADPGAVVQLPAGSPVAGA